MKNILNLCLGVLLLTSCSNKEKLNREVALKLLQDSKEYPKTISYNIFVSDQAFAKRMLEAGLEESGVVTVQRTRKLKDVGQPIITFTKKAGPYLFPQSDEEKSDGIQRVKIAEEVLEEVTGIQTDDGNKAIVEVKTSFKNISPFSTLSKLKLKTENKGKVNLVLYDDGWRIK